MPERIGRPQGQPTPARWPGEIARPGNVSITETPHTPWPYGTACHSCHHTNVHRTRDDATTAAHTHAGTCTAPQLAAIQ
ncbi:hypothetical protein [Streptomyces bobili]|uniref:hypothetical protein n=1 Tax=Streptomyces bobili TaxID=67280 RepID=UPI000A38396B|nr:hypothetical protein [Streptomyces bobili]